MKQRTILETTTIKLGDFHILVTVERDSVARYNSNRRICARAHILKE